MNFDDQAIRDDAIGYSRSCVDIAAELGSRASTHSGFDRPTIHCGVAMDIPTRL
jgi:hypothetical protein